MLRIVKNISIYTQFGRNRPIKSINGSDETVHREPFSLSRDRSIAIGRVRCRHVATRFKTREMLAVRSWSDGSDAFQSRPL